MKLLIIGGTVFLGRHLAEQALERGWEVTLLHRGRHGRELFPEAERLLADRDGPLEVLAHRSWDAAIDTCGYFPRVVERSARRLAGSVGQYQFVSSISAYAHPWPDRVDEDAPLARLEGPVVEEITGETYGPLKALCEEAVRTALPDQALVIRPGLIVGPWDPSDRFTYWPVRLSRGGKVLAPGRPERTVQFIDVRDLAAWMLDRAGAGGPGCFNATGPAEPLTMAELIQTTRQTLGIPAEPVWVDDAFLLECEVGAYGEMPLWVPESYSPWTASVERAVAAGLRPRPLAETVQDCLNWHRTRPREYRLRAGLSPRREADLLERWARREP